MQCLYQKFPRTSTILALMIFHMSNHIKIFSCMSSYMKFQVLLCRTFVTTQFTLKWLDLIVHLSMFNHVCFHDEFLFTYVTFYWFFTCKNSGVCFQFQCRKKFAGHNSHRKSHFPSLCLYICFAKESLRRKHAWQTSHSNFFSGYVL